MPNQENFASNVEQLAQQYPRYTVSRVIANKSDDLLDMEVPSEFSENILQNNVELNLYSLSDNSLIFADFIKPVSGSIYTETLQYEDGSLRKLLYIDFVKATQTSIHSQVFELPPGQYSVTLNFFANEIGAYDNRVLKVNRISTSRTEVELKLTDSLQQKMLEQFAIPRISAEYVRPALLQIFNQTGSSNLTVPMSSAKIDSSSLYQNFASGSGEKLLQYNFDDDDGSRIGINTITQNVLNIAYPIALKTVNDMILLSGSTSFTETELSKYVVDAIDIAYDSALDDEKRNPQNYRFDLI
jgi:hypothetical protein